MKAFRTWTALASLALAAGVPLLVWAGKPGGGTPPPGKIVFESGQQIYEMNGDGTGKVVISTELLTGGGTPSAKKYTHGRWFIRAELSGEIAYFKEYLGVLYPQDAYELFAYRRNGGAWERIQVTDMGSQGYVGAGWGVWNRGVWSNDGNDSFVSMRVEQFTFDDYDLDGVGIVFHDPDVVQFDTHIVRLHITGQELDTLANASLQPMITSTDAEFEIVITVPGESRTDVMWRAFEFFDWNPAGTKLCYVDAWSGWGPALYVVDVTTTPAARATTPIVTSELSSVIDLCHWSPDASIDKIVFSFGKAWTINSDGTGLVQVKDGANPLFSPPSPNGQWLAYMDNNWSLNRGYTYGVYRSTTTGASASNLTTDLPKPDPKSVLGWFAQ